MTPRQDLAVPRALVAVPMRRQTAVPAKRSFFLNIHPSEIGIGTERPPASYEAVR